MIRFAIRFEGLLYKVHAQSNAVAKQHTANRFTENSAVKRIRLVPGGNTTAQLKITVARIDGGGVARPHPLILRIRSRKYTFQGSGIAATSIARSTVARSSSPYLFAT